jgi:hypothetical protein
MTPTETLTLAAELLNLTDTNDLPAPIRDTLLVACRSEYCTPQVVYLIASYMDHILRTRKYDL